MTPPTMIMMFSRPLLLGRPSAPAPPPTTTTVEMAGGQRGGRPPSPDHVDVVLDRLPRGFLGGANSGPISTSKPTSAKALAITFWPRSWPSWPILATRMRGRRPSACSNASTSA
jgi:hypothetical protein